MLHSIGCIAQPDKATFMTDPALVTNEFYTTALNNMNGCEPAGAMVAKKYHASAAIATCSMGLPVSSIASVPKFSISPH